jgi:hypothetical protein
LSGARIKTTSSNYAKTKLRIGEATFQVAKKVSEIAKKTSEYLLLFEGDHMRWTTTDKEQEFEEAANTSSYLLVRLQLKLHRDIKFQSLPSTTLVFLKIFFTPI